MMQSPQIQFYQTNGNHMNQNEVSGQNNAATLLLTKMNNGLLAGNNPNYSFMNSFAGMVFYIFFFQKPL